MQVRELVGPLCDNAQGIFEEGNDDEEAADAREVSTGGISRFPSGQRRGTVSEDSRLDGVEDSVQQVLELARLGAQLVERTGVVRAVVVAPRVAKGALVAQMVASGAAYLRHGWWCSREEERVGGGRCRGDWVALLRTGVLHAIDLRNVRLCQRPNPLRLTLMC